MAKCDRVSEQFLNVTTAHYRLLSAIKLEVTIIVQPLA